MEEFELELDDLEDEFDLVLELVLVLFEELVLVLSNPMLYDFVVVVAVDI